jgi:hypothetical protein
MYRFSDSFVYEKKKSHEFIISFSWQNKRKLSKNTAACDFSGFHGCFCSDEFFFTVWNKIATNSYCRVFI